MRLNAPPSYPTVYTHEGAKAARVTPLEELKRSVLTCLLWEDSFYESGNTNAARIASLVPQCKPEEVAKLAIEARDRMYLRHVPLFLLRELARTKPAIARPALTHVIQRADEMGEFLALYWKDRKPGDRKRPPIAPSIKRALADAFPKFNAYQLAKYNRDSTVKLRDVMFLCHPKPKDQEQAEVWKQLVDGTLPAPDTWEVELSAGKDKKETFERLIRENKLGGLALLRNLRNMVQEGVDESLLRDRLEKGANKALPFRYIAAAKYAPRLEDSIEKGMLESLVNVPKLNGRSLLLIDVSGSMTGQLSSKSELRRLDAAAALAILCREVCEKAVIFVTAGSDMTRIHKTEEIPARKGFALSNAVQNSLATMGGGGIFLVQSLQFISEQKGIGSFDRVIVFTDEQDCDQKLNPANAPKLGNQNYMVNVAAYKNGIGYTNGWNHINGFSEHIIDYIRESEKIN